VASSFIVRRSGGRWQVRYRLSGRESRIRYGGTFRTLREARARRDWISGELAAMRVPVLEALAAPDRAPTAETVLTAAEAWRSSRLDVAAGTDATYAVSLGRILPVLGSLELDRLDTRRVARFVAELAEGGLARESIRKTLGVRNAPIRVEVATTPEAVAPGHLATHVDELAVAGKLPEDSANSQAFELLNWSFFSVHGWRWGSRLRNLLFLVHARALSPRRWRQPGYRRRILSCLYPRLLL
jgi:hypothetical protein